MKDYSTYAYGYTVSVGTYPSMNYSQLRRVSLRSLSTVYSVQGNFRTPNPHRYVCERERGLFGGTANYSPSWSQVITGVSPNVYNWRAFLPDPDTSAYNVALSQMYSKLRGNVDVSIDLIQWRKTVEMLSVYKRLVAGIAFGARKVLPLLVSYESLKKGTSETERRTRRAKRLRRELNSVADTLAQARLELVYGWLPTIGTIQDLARGCLRTREMGLIKVTGKGVRVVTTVGKDYSLTAKIPLYHDITTSTRSKIVCFFNPRPGLLDNLQQITSLNPVSILYEACPFSFVLDWAVNFSGFLRSFETAFIHKNDFVFGYVTTTTRNTVFSHMSGSYTDLGVLTTMSYQGTAVRTVFDRSVLGSAPFPTKPVVSQNFGIERILNGLALAKTVLPKADLLVGPRRR